MFTMRKAGLIPLFVVFLANLCFAYCYRITEVSCGEYHSLLLADNGSLWACGSNGNLALGTDEISGTTDTLVQVKGENGIGYLNNIVSFDAGWYHSLACDESGKIWAWGKDTKGQLGNGSGGNSMFPQRVLGIGGVGYLDDIVYVSAGRSGEHSLAINDNGYVYAWGYNLYGQCGNGNNVDQQTPVRVIKTNGDYLSNIIEVNAGVHHSLALDENGDVWEFGSNNGQNRAVVLTGLPDIIHVATCGQSLALDVNGNVWYWTTGTPSRVVCGDMNTQSGYLENIKEISAGHGYNVAVDNDGFVWKWTNGGSPVRVTDGQMSTNSGYLENIDNLDAGYFEFQLAVDNDGVA